MMGYHASVAAAAAFLGVVCAEGFAVFIWRFMREGTWREPPLEFGIARAATRRALFFWLALALLLEASHDALRALFFVLDMQSWPHVVSFWITLAEAGAVLGLIRTFTRRACGEWGWTVAAILPLIVATGVLFR